MNKLTFTLIFIIGLSFYSIAQDIDIFHKKTNDNFKFENINPQMNIDEYRILSRSLGMKEMLYSMVVPGYVHFYANENKLAYGILALRAAAVGELTYMIATDKIDFSLIKPVTLSFNDANIPRTEVYLTYGSIAVIVGTYLYDWIHGQYVLKKKQENIRYKYNMKMNLSFINTPNGIPTPGVSLNIQF